MMIRPTSPTNYAGRGHQSQIRYVCSAHCVPATALVITLQVGKMRVLPCTPSAFYPLSHPHPAVRNFTHSPVLASACTSDLRFP